MKVRAAFLAAMLAWTGPADADPKEPAQPEPTLQLTYGAAPSQAIDIFLPASAGPHPVVILVHGGCWSSKLAGRDQVRPMANELMRRGIAVWSIGYRRADEPGGGYPGTFQDVADAIDRLPSEAIRFHLDITRTVLVGHSAGGHLALWAASRNQLPASSPLHREAPFVPPAVISLGGIGDLKAFAPKIPGLCGPGVLEHLTADPASGSHDVYPEISPALLPANGHVVMISGNRDEVVPPGVALAYTHEVEGKRREPVELVNIPQARHMDLITPGTPAWEEVYRHITQALGIAPNPPRRDQ